MWREYKNQAREGAENGVTKIIFRWGKGVMKNRPWGELLGISHIYVSAYLLNFTYDRYFELYLGIEE